MLGEETNKNIFWKTDVESHSVYKYRRYIICVTESLKSLDVCINI